MARATDSRYLKRIEQTRREAPRSPWAEWLLPSPGGEKPRAMRRALWPLALGLGYIAGIAWLGGLRGDHFLIGGLSALDFYNAKSRLFLRRFFPFILTGVIYDSMRYYYWAAVEGRVRVREPYLRDRNWFALREAGTTEALAPHDYFRRHPSVVLDLVCGFAYLTFVAEYLALAFWLFFKGEYRWLRAFGFGFLGVNVLGWITYFVYPAAPPWYVTKFGFAPPQKDVAPDPASTVRFDQILGTDFFSGIYSRNVAVYGAYPSLHVSYPFLVAGICFLHPELRWLRWPATGFYLLMCFSAVYLQHHYVVDVILGTLYAAIIGIPMTLYLSHGTDRPMLREARPAAFELL